jgi:hypothetical protein
MRSTPRGGTDTIHFRFGWWREEIIAVDRADDTFSTIEALASARWRGFLLEAAIVFLNVAVRTTPRRETETCHRLRVVGVDLLTNFDTQSTIVALKRTRRSGGADDKQKRRHKNLGNDVHCPLPIYLSIVWRQCRSTKFTWLKKLALLRPKDESKDCERRKK